MEMDKVRREKIGKEKSSKSRTLKNPNERKRENSGINNGLLVASGCEGVGVER